MTWDEGAAANAIGAVMRVFNGEDLSGDSSTLKPIPKPAAAPGVASGGGGGAIPHAGNTDPNGLQSFLAATKQHESGGNYGIYNQSGLSDASGAYQFISTTWGGYGGYHNAAEAPPEVQDAKAAEMASQLFERYHDWRLVAIAWYGGPGIADQAAAGQDPGNPDQQGSYLAYGDTIVRMMAGDG